ncbi:MAG: hypothetical protein AB1656_04525 [Candidatus Omnitrophota bacterium]
MSNLQNTTHPPRGSSIASPQGPENRSSASLVVAGLVTIVGSWVGMAAYVDYRLDGMEKNLAAETQKAIAAEARPIASSLENNKSSLDRSLTSLQEKVLANLNEKSSVLAKGILDLNQKEDEYFAKTTQSLAENSDGLSASLRDSFKNSQNELTALLAQNQENASKQFTDAIDNLKGNLNESQTVILSKIETSTISLKDLVELSNKNQTDNLAALASLANLVKDSQHNIASAQTSLDQLNNLMPGWRKTNEEQLAALGDKTGVLEQGVKETLAALQDKFADLKQTVGAANESMMKTLFLTSEGVEGTKSELKSDVAGVKDETCKGLKQLNESMVNLSTVLENIKKESAKSAAVPLKDSKEFKTLASGLDSLAERLSGARSEMTRQFEAARDRARAYLAGTSDPDQVKQLEEVFQQFSGMAEQVDQQLDSMNESLKSLTGAIAILKTDEKGSGVSSISDTSAQPKAPPSGQEIGMNPENRASQ